MTRSGLPNPEHGLAALLNVFVGGVLGLLAHFGGRAWLAGNTYIADVAAIAALAFLAIVILAQVSDWAYWRGERPALLDPEKRAQMTVFRRYSLLIGFGFGLVVPFVWVPSAFRGLP